MCEQGSVGDIPEGLNYCDALSVEELIAIISLRCESFIFCCREKILSDEANPYFIRNNGPEAYRFGEMIRYILKTEMIAEAASNAPGCVKDEDEDPDDPENDGWGLINA